MKPPDDPITNLPKDEALRRIRRKMIEVYGPHISAQLIADLEEEERFEHAIRKLSEIFGPPEARAPADELNETVATTELDM